MALSRRSCHRGVQKGDGRPVQQWGAPVAVLLLRAIAQYRV